MRDGLTHNGRIPAERGTPGRYVAFLQSTYAPGDPIHMDAERMRYPDGLHRPTLNVVASQLAKAGLLARVKRGVYGMTEDLKSLSVHDAVDLWRMAAKAKGKPRKATTTEPPPDPRVDVDPMDVLRAMDLPDVFACVQALVDERVAASDDGKDAHAEADRLRRQLASAERESERLRGELLAERTRVMELRERAARLREPKPAVEERRILVRTSAPTQRTVGGSGPFKPATVKVNRRPLTGHMPGGIKRHVAGRVVEP